MSVHKLAARCRVCPHCLACLAAAQVAMFGAVGDWRRWRVVAVVAPSSLADVLRRTAGLRARAGVDRVARSELRASWRRRVRAGCAAWVDAVGAVNAVCPARGTVASRDFGSLCRANFSSPKFPLKPGLHATSVHSMHVCAAVKLQTHRIDLARTDSQRSSCRETFRRAVSRSNRHHFARICHDAVYQQRINMT